MKIQCIMLYLPWYKSEDRQDIALYNYTSIDTNNYHTIFSKISLITYLFAVRIILYSVEYNKVLGFDWRIITENFEFELIDQNSHFLKKKKY